MIRAVMELDAGLIDADLGGLVVKKRIGLPGRGKRGGARTLLAYRSGTRAVFLFGFAKNERENIDGTELKALQKIAAIYLVWGEEQLAHALRMGELIEVCHD